jgi:hypothetical protein
MGAGESVPRELTHEKLFELTKDTRAIMNYILDYMIKEVTVKDFLALSNPSECKKYVLFMANSLYKYFYELQIEPVKDRKGVIAFRSIKDLVSPSQNTDQEKQSLCLILAYYYARIFQIYGALALTLIDDISFMSSTGILTTIQGDQQRLLAPGQRQVIYGGEISEASLGLFAFLKDFLNDIQTPKGYLTKYTSKVLPNAKVYFQLSQSSSASNTNLIVRTSENKGIFNINDGISSYYSNLEITVDQTSSSSSIYSLTPAVSKPKIRVTIGKLSYVKKGSTDKDPKISIDIPSTYLSTKTFDITQHSLPDKKTTYYMIAGKEISLNDFLNGLLDKVVYFVKELIRTGSPPSKFPELITDPMTGQYIIRETPSSSTTTPINSVSATEQDTVDELKLSKIIYNLKQTKPLGHCIARALQLLKTVPFKDEPGISYICKAKFYETGVKDTDGTKSSRSGIPIPGKKLSDSPGLLALSQLFYDSISVGTPKLTINEKKGPSGKSSLDQYIEFMTKMSIYFGDKKTPEEIRVSGLESISNKRDKEICDEMKQDNILIPNNVARNVYSVVRQLFQQQLQHSSVCGSIFKLLFNIKRDPLSNRVTISLSDNILKKGIPEINRINYIARQHLIDYYSNCERKYLDGIKLIVDSVRQRDPERLQKAKDEALQKRLKQLGHIRDTYRKKAQETQDPDEIKKYTDEAEKYDRAQQEFLKQLQQQQISKPNEQKTVRFTNQPAIPTTYAPSAPPMAISSAAPKPTTTVVPPALKPSIASSTLKSSKK